MLNYLVRRRFVNRTDPKTGNIRRAAIDIVRAKRLNMNTNELEFLVVWQSHAHQETWEPADHLSICKDLIANLDLTVAKQQAMKENMRSFMHQPEVKLLQNSSASTSNARQFPSRLLVNRINVLII